MSFGEAVMRSLGNTLLKGSIPLASLTEAYHQAPAMMARYTLAAPYVAGKRVCDIACGAGYGSCFLSQCARQVVGMDISQETVFWAKKHFKRSNLSFLQGDGTQPWPLRQSFQVVVSFETLEHTVCPEAFLEQIHDHLEPGGTLIMSVPNGPRDKQRHQNPYHRHHFTSNQLESLIGRFFPEPRYFSQCYQKDLYHYLARPWRVLRRYHHQIARNYHFAEGLLSEIKTWVVIAVKE